MSIKEENLSQCIERVDPGISHRETNNSSSDDAITELESKLLWRLDKRIMPICALIYLLCFLDRANIGNARTLNADVGNDLVSTLGMSQLQFIMALMTFLIAYALFEVPSNYLLKKTSPSTWLAFLMVCFGVLTMSIGASKNFATIAALRFMLGMFEAGVFPGLVYYITFWYKGNERSIRVAVFFASATLAGAFGGVLAYGVGQMNQVRGLEGWRWLFILEGMLSVVASVGVYFLLPDYPEKASWLSAEEKILATSRLQEGSISSGQNAGITWETVKQTLREGRLWIHYLIFFLASPPFSSFSLFAPSITTGLGYSGLHGQLMTVPPYAAAYVSMIISSYLADKFNARGVVATIAGLVGGAGYLASALLPPTSYTVPSCVAVCLGKVHEAIGCDEGDIVCLCKSKTSLISKVGLCVVGSQCDFEDASSSTDILQDMCDLVADDPGTAVIASASKVLDAVVASATVSATDSPTSTNAAGSVAYDVIKVVVVGAAAAFAI
ncbi:hypothetical protein FSPOR_3412 [Fusarium sporotrichioides]|uniref:Uncharacterized protein n=1 Tax=Fusarium sporotrichioides TaxID=5514 RepID=A0A395SFZ2_FUSSP|nr:hypothetical protein FSPOR_3412 [Fusarium sporotrichioides]